MQASNLPTGTVTFLFTDIEGSTRLWQEAPEGMQLALVRHDRILEQTITSSGGHLLKHTGDGVFAVFARAEQALAASIDAQRRFAVEEFPGVGHLKVRMGVHTGEGQGRHGDYFGPAPSRTARLMSVGHGGQVLVSAATREVLGDTEIGFVDLGAHRLRDLARPEHVYQLRHEDLLVEFPPLASVDAHPNNLPVQLTSFVGREAEVQEVSRLLSEGRLVTLTGVGGTGKTRLSLRVAAELTSSYSDGAWLVELAPVEDPKLVVGQVADTFGVRAMKTGRRLIQVLTDYLADKDLLLVLDNCEHVVGSSAALVESLLAKCSQLKIIATSRELLGVPGEAVYGVPPLAVPEFDSEETEESEAVRLFGDRASQVQARFRLSPDNLSTVQAIARRLDGLPLAIELAASRANLLTAEQMLQRLDDQFRLITSSRRDRGRHTTLETAMDWSYDLLSPEEQLLFRQLAVFTGGWTLEAAEVVGLSPDVNVVELLGRLVDQSLVVVTEVGGSHRYRLLEPVRHYALGKLAEAGEEREARDRHLEYFVELAEASDSGLRGHQQEDWARRVELEHDNLRSALEWSLGEKQDEFALRLATGLAWFWWIGGYWKEARDWFHRVYDATPDADPVLRGRAVYRLAGLEIQRARPADVLPLFDEALPAIMRDGTETDIAWMVAQLADGASDPQRGVELATDSVRRFSGHGDLWGEAYAQMTLGFQLRSQDQPRSNELMRSAIDALSDLGDKWTAGWFSFNFGYFLALAGHYDDGRQVIEDSLDMVTDTFHRWVVPHCKGRLAAIATMTGDHRKAKQLFKEALPVHRQIGDENCTALVSTYLGELYSDEGQIAAARLHLTDGMEGFRDLDNPSGVAFGLRRMGWLAAGLGEHEQAATVLGAADALRRDIGGLISEHDRRRMAEVTDLLEIAVAAKVLEDRWAFGATMNMGEAIEFACRG